MSALTHASRTPSERESPATGIFRPVQYLGCKLRSLSAVLDAVSVLAPAPSRVADLFTGTSVVAQGLARQGHRVAALDAMGYSALFARAMLGIERTSDKVRAVELLAALEVDHVAPSWVGAWLEAAAEEEAALASVDAGALLEATKTLPQIWRQNGASTLQRDQFAELIRQTGTSDEPAAGIATTHYAGTYFGVRQAIEIDLLRSAIRRAARTRSIGVWEESVLLTALLSASSDAVFSAGKHFAQPHRVRSGKDMSFLRRRILDDRAIDVRRVFEARVAQVLYSAEPYRETHVVIESSLESVGPHALAPIDVVYADPPYTAQQYSRYYHILEVLFCDRVPVLQQVKGRVTRGLYPDRKFNSRFCSKRGVQAAFRDLFTLTDRLGADLVLSYSGSKSGVSGNDRMVSLKELVAALRSTWPMREVQVEELPHDYRQFNHNSCSVVGRADAEFLVIAGRA